MADLLLRIAQVFHMKPEIKFIREKTREPFYTKFTLRKQERWDLIREIGEHGLVLFEMYLRMAAIENIELTDEDAAIYFGWNIHTASRYRRALVKGGWLHVEKARSSNGQLIVLYYLGKDEVSAAKANQKVSG